jgi:chloramphenicol 3-O-phosphotransferase
LTQVPIFIITGAPGAGKSSVAAALLRRFPFGLHIPVDDLREMVVAGIAHPVPEWTEETTRQFRLAREAAARMAEIYAAAGFAVAIDDVITPDEARALFAEPLAGFVVHKVLLRPSLDAALARNAARAHKDFDTAVLDGAIRFVHQSADLGAFEAEGWQILDSTALALEATVDAILAAAEAGRAGEPPAIDKRGVLDQQVFSYRASKGKVFISWRGKPVMTLKGREAGRFLSRIDGLTGKEAQLVMAKITGNFKRGNERS